MLMVDLSTPPRGSREVAFSIITCGLAVGALAAVPDEPTPVPSCRDARYAHGGHNCCAPETCPSSPQSL